MTCAWDYLPVIKMSKSRKYRKVNSTKRFKKTIIHGWVKRINIPLNHKQGILINQFQTF